MNNFEIVKKGYNTLDVDNYINTIKSNYELKIGEYRVTISDLNSKIEFLEKELIKYKEKEETVSKSIIKAVEKAEEIEYTSKVRFALEGERVRVFKEKWLSYINQYLDKMSPDFILEVNNYLAKVEKEAFLLFQKEFHIKDYFEETGKYIDI